MRVKAQDAPLKGPTLPLLMVDDDPFALELQLRVASEAFPESRITTTSDPAAVVGLCAATEFACVLLDYDMPKLNGLALARLLREGHPHLPLVLCTGAGDEMLAAKALQGGVTDYIPKSAIRPPALRRTVLHAIRVAESAQTIDRQRSELETFAFALAHDFKQPLRQITTFSQLALEDVESGALDDVRRHLAFLSGAARRLCALVDVMSQYTLLNRPLELEAVTVSEVLDGVRQSLEGYIGERRGVVEFQGDAVVLGNPVFLHQVLQNLIVNGLKYNVRSQPRIEVRTSRKGRTCLIRVKDDGIGIGRDYLEQVFKPLARLHTDAEYTGTGLGLTMARKAAAAQGGAIVCTSEPGVGSEFLVSLPLAPAVASAA